MHQLHWTCREILVVSMLTCIALAWIIVLLPVMTGNFVLRLRRVNGLSRLLSRDPRRYFK